MTLRNIKRILVIGEKNIFHELSEILELGSQANAIMTNMLLDGYKGKPLAEEVKAIKTLEKNSDEITFKVSQEITGGAVSPNVLDDLLEAVQLADTILDLYYGLSRDLGRMSKVELEGSEVSFDVEYAADFEKMLNLARGALLAVKNLLSASNLDDMINIRKEIEVLEEQGDDIKDVGFDKLFIESPKMHYIQFLHNSEVFHKLDDILDTCEDLSDIIVSIVNSILK